MALVAGGALAWLDAVRVAAKLPTPWLGVTERINIYGYMLWMAVLAITLLRVQDASAPTASFMGGRHGAVRPKPRAA